MFTLTKDWLTAGDARFTVHNNSGDHYTYRIRKLDDGWRRGPRPRWFVSVLTAPDNYTYLGCLNPTNGKVSITCASQFTTDSRAARVINWALRLVWTGTTFPDGYGLCGEGRCGRCGRPLTHPDGVADDGYRHGFGPECWKHICGRAA